MEQLLLHLLGDYVTQSDWMAQNKTSKYLPAVVHATVYTLPFILLTRSPAALFVMWLTHFLIDRFRLARYVCFVKNLIFAPISEHSERHVNSVGDVHYIPKKYFWSECKATGYHPDTPIWLATGLMIIADNFMHLTINYLCLRYL